MAISKSLKKKLLKSTGFFEGSDGFSNLAGNFDGMGLSFGIIQYNFGKGTLQPVLKDYIRDNESEFKSIFGTSKAATLKKVVFDYSKNQQVSWGDSITESRKSGKVKAEWREPFQEMGTKSKMQDIQVEHAQDYFDRAESLANKFGIISTQGLAFLFDHVVQSWNFEGSHSKIEREIDDLALEYQKNESGARLPDEDRLSVLLDYVRSGDETDRRRAIKNGSGKVHGKQYDVDDYGLSYDDEF
ncbi:hypothetical protein HPY31_21005 [Brevibacillus sp. HB1.3]|uniref:hypothetical protein n=1 Tax=Brevibacillus sp. HB1.3 TaxID=2738842 RepID=UPI0015517994|nr:hypothetical protein [Brevibacillus sp. HB1.3]NQF16365.1 hypothetical protein [Brevibacillus sp. HB1.3]